MNKISKFFRRFTIKFLDDYIEDKYRKWVNMLCEKGECDYNKDNECLLPYKCPMDYNHKEAIEK